jgi:phosphatidylinositol kinase/protein kinase (PI-3  family)
MKVMRENKESLLAIMEAFVYDPLISFRLLNPKMFKKHKEDQEGVNEKGTVALEGATHKAVT